MILAVVLVGEAMAQTPKFSRCLTRDEASADQLVRHGVLLREASRRCDDMRPGAKAKWLEFDQKFAPRLQKQTSKRARLFEREFKGNAKEVMTYFDGRLVTYFRHYPLSTSYCQGIDQMLDEVKAKGWRAYQDQAKRTQNQTMLDYRVCN